ncbi:MAG: CehA/McbA family metallohydrolase [Proteobacteria bacterium]|nr:CehA/McbA family metallohydrolase [Pseudomonadota bacterium]
MHSEKSDDSAFALRERVRAFAASGAEVVVATDHDYVADYGPVIAAMGLSDAIVSIVGGEVTGTVRSRQAPHTMGHANAFPLTRRPEAYRAGAPFGEARRLRDVVAALRARPEPVFVQLNHPRNEHRRLENNDFLTHLSVVGEPFDPMRPLSAEGNRALVERDPDHGLRDLDFDGIELLNGSSLGAYWMTRADWFSWLLQGEARTATATSDSHRAGEIAALPRTYVALASDRVSGFDRDAFVAALRAGRAYGTTGPILSVRLGEAGPGQRYAGETGRLHVRAQAAPWVPVDRVRVYVNGDPVESSALSPGVAVEFPLVFAADAFVTVEVEGEPGELYRIAAPGFRPFAFSNPIFVDADGDGEWTPPGLPSGGALPVTIVAPLSERSRGLSD